MSKIVYLCVKTSHYFLLIAMMTKTMFANPQQLLFIILFSMWAHYSPWDSHDLFVSFYFFLFSFIPLESWKNNHPLTQHKSLLYNSRTRLHRRIIKQSSKLDHTKLYSTRSRYYQKDRTKRNGKDRSVMVICYRGTPPSLAVDKGSAHTKYSVLLCWWRGWSCWWCWLLP